ncbi:MAG: outer membrane beta-barrel protein [Chlorobi bacterium]|nr:outer membrane beta-barrel protein [Chlorobiota bacterium]
MFISLVCIALFCFAEVTAQQGEEQRVREASGDFALLFDLSGLGDLALQGLYGGQLDSTTVSGGFGAKYLISDKLALRGAIGFFRTSGTDTFNFQQGSGQSLSSDISTTTVMIAPSLTYNISTSNSVAGYVGGGLQYIAATTSVDVNDTTAIFSSKSSSTASGFGGGAVFGIEWFPWENVSLSAEYTFGFTTSSSSVEYTVENITTTVESPSTTGIGISSRGRLTAGFYL